MPGDLIRGNTVIIFFLNLSENPQNNYLFLARWLEDEWFKYWIRGKNDTVAICNYCSKDVSVANMEEAPLTPHMKGKKHVQRSSSDQCMKSWMPPPPASPLITLKISLSGVWSFQ